MRGALGCGMRALLLSREGFVRSAADEVAVVVLLVVAVVVVLVVLVLVLVLVVLAV